MHRLEVPVGPIVADVDRADINPTEEIVERRQILENMGVRVDFKDLRVGRRFFVGGAGDESANEQEWREVQQGRFHGYARSVGYPADWGQAGARRARNWIPQLFRRPNSR